ncbi:MAG: ShlB/FhaC/HecB family hemolysin secretion/activation protein [Prochlorotrichaceae cyanobacterium]
MSFFDRQYYSKVWAISMAAGMSFVATPLTALATTPSLGADSAQSLSTTGVLQLSQVRPEDVDPSFLRDQEFVPIEIPDYELPPADELLQTAPILGPYTPRPNLEQTIVVRQFEVRGSTVFTSAELNAALQDFLNRPVTFTDLVLARDAITKLYVEQGYSTSGAYLPEAQPFENNTIIIEVLEGRLGDIQVNSTGRVGDRYIRSRIRRFAQEPLNVNKLVEGLQLLQLEPMVRNISAELTTSAQPGESLLNLNVTQNPSFRTFLNFDNGRSPSVGSQRQRLRLEERSLFGQNDRIEVGYGLSPGSEEISLNYTIPFNNRNGTAALYFSDSTAEVIEKPFDILNIESRSQSWEFTVRQPLLDSPTQNFGVGLTFSHRFSQTTLDGRDFPLALGAEPDGSTRISVVRFFQDWNRQNGNQVISLRSQFNIGTDWFNANRGLSSLPGSEGGLDGQFASWQGQAQYVRVLPLGSLLLAKFNTQLTNHTLLGLEQFGVGGQGSVRGYRQDSVLTDNGLFTSLEVRVPFAQIPRGRFSVAPFLDYGMGWNSGDFAEPERDKLLSTGFGLLFEYSDRVSARLDWGIPLLSVSRGESLQEQGLSFFLEITPIVF